jgi:hypothetical protein
MTLFFKIKNYHPRVVSLLSVKAPKAYLIPKNDTVLVQWLMRSRFNFEEYIHKPLHVIFEYEITDRKRRVDEELENWFVEITKHKISSISNEYYKVPVNQKYAFKIITACEPQAMYGLSNYEKFDYLLKSNKFPILRIE